MYEPPKANLEIEPSVKKSKLVLASLIVLFGINAYVGLSYVLFGFTITVARFTPPGWAFSGRGIVSLFLAVLAYFLYRQRRWGYHLFFGLILVNTLFWYLCTYKNIYISLAYLFIQLIIGLSLYVRFF